MYGKAGARWWRSNRVEIVDTLYRFGASQDPHKGVGSLARCRRTSDQLRRTPVTWGTRLRSCFVER